MTSWHSARPVPWLRFEGKGSCEWHLANFFPRGVPPALALAFLRSSLQVIVQFLFMTWPRFFSQFIPGKRHSLFCCNGQGKKCITVLLGAIILTETPSGLMLEC